MPFASSRSSSFAFFDAILINGAATKNETTVATATPAKTGSNPPFGAIAINANILPGEGVATSPAPNIVNTNIPDAPPAITANTSSGFINTYGK